MTAKELIIYALEEVVDLRGIATFLRKSIGIMRKLGFRLLHSIG
jgi:hypothetical protein